MVALHTEDQRLSASCHHQSLPGCFSFGDIFQLPNVMNLEWALLRLAVLTLTGIQSSDQLRTAEGKSERIGRDIDPWVVCRWGLEVP